MNMPPGETSISPSPSDDASGASVVAATDTPEDLPPMGEDWETALAHVRQKNLTLIDGKLCKIMVDNMYRDRMEKR